MQWPYLTISVLAMTQLRHNKVKFVIDELKLMAFVQCCIDQAMKFAEFVVPSIPRTTGHHHHRDNTEHSSIEEYYRRCIIIDNLIQYMEERFGNTEVLASKLLCLVPSELLRHQNSLSYLINSI